MTAISRLLLAQGPESVVSKRWLWRTGSRLDRRFQRSVSYEVHEAGEFLKLTIGTEIFLWPRESPITGLLQILSEILTPGHPHQYVYGPTTIDADDVVLDIGACEGAFSAIVTSRCRRVIAVEPSQAMCRLIAELFRVRRQPSPDMVNRLLGRESGQRYFTEDGANPGASRASLQPSSGAYPVAVQTLDELADSLPLKPTFIKCDAEGFEPDIFAGGVKFLAKYRPKLAITTYHNDGDYTALAAILKPLGYRIMGKGFLFSQGKLRVQMLHAW